MIFLKQNSKHGFFAGWYFKHQASDGTGLALIPAIHRDGSGHCKASLQVISDRTAWWLDYPEGSLLFSAAPFAVHLGENRFCRQGMELRIERDGLSLHGSVSYGVFSALRSDIMGPFRFVPHMECSHGVVSMGHSLDGQVTLNGEVLDFSGGRGYVETDRGFSFPKAYLWTQCLWSEPKPVSLMLSIATIPLGPLRFTGCICAVRHGAAEYRLATYRGARVEKWSGKGAVLRQGNRRLEVRLLSGSGLTLKAPVRGAMERTVHETLCATVRYRLWDGSRLIFDHTDCHAGFEYSCPSVG